MPKHKKNKSVNLYNSLITQDNSNNNNHNNSILKQSTLTNQTETNNINVNIYANSIGINEKKLSKYNNHNYLSIKDLKVNNVSGNTNSSHSPVLKSRKNNLSKTSLKRNKSSLQKMFIVNPLKNDKVYNEKMLKLKMAKKKDLENNNNYYITPMRFDIEYPNKFEGIGITVNKEANMKQKTENVIFYNIKVNEKIKTLKYFEGDDLKLDVINFVSKNKLPEEVADIILTKIKEKTMEEAL